MTKADLIHAVLAGPVDTEIPRPQRAQSARTAATAVALTATLGLAATSWVVAVRQMRG